MNSELAEADDADGPGSLEASDVDEQLEMYLKAASIPNLAAYRSDWSEFEAWCRHGRLWRPTARTQVHHP